MACEDEALEALGMDTLRLTLHGGNASRQAELQDFLHI